MGDKKSGGRSEPGGVLGNSSRLARPACCCCLALVDASDAVVVERALCVGGPRRRAAGIANDKRALDVDGDHN